MSSWRECKLGDILELKYGKDHKALKDGNIPVFGSGGIMRYADTSLYDDESILIPRKGTLNNIFYINEPFWTVDTIFWSKINTKEAFGKFLFYQLKTIDFANLNVGSAVPSLTTKVLNEVDISLPSLEEQKEIAEVLSSLDDKIDLLHRQNQTLESLAQTLFRQWFIDGNGTLVPSNWEEKPLSQIADFLNGLACQKIPPQNDIDKLPVLKIKDLKDGISENSDYATSDVKPEYIVNNGDVIFAWSASLMVKIWNGDKCVLNQHLFKVTSRYYPKWFYYQWCKYHLDNFIDIASEHATTMGHIKRSDLDEAICLVPNIDELDKMAEQFNPIMEKLEINSKQIQTLENLRDTLLPKLLSGEVRVENGK